MKPEPSVAELTAVFARVQGMLLSQEAATSAVHQLAQVARDLIDSAVGAGVSLLEPGRTGMTTAATDRVVEAADTLQYDLDEGPCLSAWATAAPQRIDDTAADARWPAWSRAALRLGVRSVLSVPLVFREDVLGALKIYATTEHAFTADDERMLGLLATAAATLLGVGQASDAPHRLGTALQAALADRQTVDTAIGMLMERRSLTEQDARRLLLETAHTHHRSLLETARQLVDRTADPGL